MDQITNTFVDTFQWARRDFREWPLRFCLEVFAWALSIGCSIAMMLTVPNPPLHLMYPFWIAGCVIYCWAAWTRGSFGMVANYLLLSTIDIIALIKMWVER